MECRRRLGGGRLWALPRAALGDRVGACRTHHRRQSAERHAGTQRPGTRLHLGAEEVLRLLEAADALVAASAPSDAERMHKAEQIRLLVRLAADSGARRGELVALRFDDLEGRVLTIERGVSADMLGPTKTGRTRRLTLGRRTAELWRSSTETWAGRLPEGAALGPWVFSPEASHDIRLTAGALGHWFAGLARTAEVPGATLHRLRHSVATFLVGRGELLRAQQRLGHRDPSTTLRNYAHAMPLEDEAVADDIDQMLETQAESSERGHSTDTS